MAEEAKLPSKLPRSQPAPGLRSDPLRDPASISRTSFDLPRSPYISGITEQADEIKKLQVKLAELEEALKRERHRADIYQQQLDHHLSAHRTAELRPQYPSHLHSHALNHSSVSRSSSSVSLTTLQESSVLVVSSDTSRQALSEQQPVATSLSAEQQQPLNAGLDGVVTAQVQSDSFPDGQWLPQGAGEYVTITKQEYELLLLKERAMDVVQEGITIADFSQPDMPLIYANAGFARITGYQVKETLGKNCRFLQGEGTDKNMLQELKDAIQNGKACVVQLMNYKKNGDPFINYLSVAPIYDRLGRLTHYVGIQSDITELVNHKKAELAAKHAALQAAAATEAKSQFLARMSHEIRTPLNGMIAVGQLLAETSLSPAQWDLVNTIRCSGETLLTLITDILDFSRIEANKMVLNMSTFRLETVIEAAMEIAGLRAAQKRLQVAYHISEDTPRLLYGDAQRLQQILLNILNNGVKFTEVGQLLLEVWPEPLPAQPRQPDAGSSSSSSSPNLSNGAELMSKEQRGAQTTATFGTSGSGSSSAAASISAHAERALGRVSNSGSGPSSNSSSVPQQSEPDWPSVVIHFSVRDTGIGISENDLGRLFHSFSQVDASPTRRYGGSGLGLAISRKLCEAMGGQMWAESPGLGKGSTFQWTITCKVPRVSRKQRRNSQLQFTGRTTRIGELLNSRASVDSGTGRTDSSFGGCSSITFQGPVSPILTEDDAASLVSSEASLHIHHPHAASQDTHLPRDLSSLMAPPGGPSSSGRAGGDGDVSLPLLRGKKVLLVEPCDLVRQVLKLALRSWGCQVRAVGSEANAIQQLVENGTLSTSSAPTNLPPPQPPAKLSLPLRFGSQIDQSKFRVPGPYDVVMMDMSCTQLLGALTQCDEREAQRLVFMGWPGQNEPDEPVPAIKPEAEYDFLPGSQEVQARPPRAVTEEMSKPQSRQLGYVTVTRPVRQGRLKLALEEVLMMQLDTSSTAHMYWNDEQGQGEGGSPHQEQHLPALKPAPVKKAPSAPQIDELPALSESNLQILLAEDNAINMKVALGILKRLGYTQVVTVENGVQALEAIATRGGPDAFDLILMDLHMPLMGGMEVVKEMNSKYPNRKVRTVAVTADAFEDTRDLCLNDGFDGWLPKPFRIEDLVRIISEHTQAR